jgi:hypothetical protein
MYPSRIPEIYKLITNDGEFLVNCHPTFLQSAQYMTNKAKQGMAIKDIIFRVIPVKLPNTSEALKGLI